MKSIQRIPEIENNIIEQAHPFLEKLALNLESMFCHIPYGKSGNLS